MDEKVMKFKIGGVVETTEWNSSPLIKLYLESLSFKTKEKFQNFKWVGVKLKKNFFPLFIISDV